MIVKKKIIMEQTKPTRLKPNTNGSCGSWDRRQCPCYCCPSCYSLKPYDNNHHQSAIRTNQSADVGAARLMVPMLLLSSFMLLSLDIPSARALIQVPNRHTVASIPGDLVLGILVPVHERPSPKQAQTRTCGAVREQYGIQRVEAAFRTIDSINADSNILPNITLGIEIRDSCWHSPIALEQSIEFIRDAMAASEQSTPAASVAAGAPGTNHLLNSQQQPFNRQPTTQTLSSFVEQQINSNTNTNNSACAPLLRQQQLQLMQTKKVKNLVGVVGPASSTDTVQVQNLLQLFNMPQVGYSATSRDLSNKNFFKYFLRVVPSDKLQAQVLIDLMLAHNWTYITVAYTEGSYGSSLMNEFRERAQEAGICFATLESMPPNADDAKFDELIQAIQKHPNARVVICMCEGRTVGRLFAGFKRKNINNEYLVVGRFDVVEQQEEFALGGISIRIHSAYVHDFDDYYFSLSPFTNQRNPWFAEFWETRFQCNLEMPPTSASSLNSNRPAYIRPPGAKVYNRTCTGKESLRQNHKQDAKMAFVQKSIITMALALDSMQRAICPHGRVGLCPEMLPVNGSILLQHLMNVSFSFLDEEVYFDEQGDPPGKYEILNFRRRRKSSSSSASNNFPPSDADENDNAENPATGSLEPPNLSADVDNEDEDGDESTASAMDSNANENQDFSIVSSPGNVNKANNNNNNNKKIKRPYADSYSTLKVFRSPKRRHANEQVSSRESDAGGVSVKRRRHAGAKGRQQLHWTPGVVAPSAGRTRLIINKRHQQQRHRNRQRAQQHQLESYSSTSDFEYVHVGSWKSSDGLSLFGDIQWPLKSQANVDIPHWSVANDSSESSYHFGSAPTPGSVSNFSLEPPKSICSFPCAKGHAKKIQSDSVKCCWVCVACRPREYLFNEFKCKACEKGWWPNSDQTGCNQIPIRYLDWRSMEALSAISIASFGLILTLATGFVFIKHNDTPVVKSSTRELSYMILFAMVLCYVNTFFLIAKPRKETCFVTRILPGFSFAMMYGALVTKTNRIARILAGSKKKIITRRPYFMSATAQVTITWLIVLIECAIIVSILIKEPPDKMHDYPSDDRVVLVCNTTTTGIIAPLGFDFFLIAMCTLYAFKTRNVPENFNEAKFIGFTMYTTLVIWVAFVAIYLSSDHKVTTLCLCISFSALFALFLLFFPRCYIILFKPEKNNRSFFTTTKNVRCHIGYQITATPAAGVPPTTTTTTSTSNNNTAGSGPNCQWSNWPATTTAGQPIASISSRQLNNCQQQCPCSLVGWPLQLPTGSPKDQPLDQQLDEQQQWRPNQRHNSRSLATASGRRVAPANDSGSGDLQYFGLEGPSIDNQDPNSAAELGPRALTSNGVNNPAGGHRPSGDSLRHLFGSLRSAFARRSKRKESDKQSSIQQHLRAIRHAENLDRQTHFRRSQVQRLAQRFESNPNTPTTSFKPPSWLPNHYQQLLTPSSSFKDHHHHRQQQQHNQLNPTMMFQFSEGHSDIGESLMLSLDAKLELLTRGYEAERLLATLNQLIGIENVWRLAAIMNRFLKTQQTTADSSHEENKNNNDAESTPNDRVGDKTTRTICQAGQAQARQHFPLDLRRLADRHLALAWLRFLIQMAYKAMGSLQLNCNHVQSASDQRDLAKLLSLDNGRRRATLDRLEGTGALPGLASLLCEPMERAGVCPPTSRPIIDQEANQGRQDEHLDQSEQPRTALVTTNDHHHKHEDDKDDDQRQTRQAVDYSRPSRPRPCSPSSSCPSNDGKRKSAIPGDEPDPIKRALDCISGKQWSGAVGGTTRRTSQLSSQSGRRKQPPHNNNNDDDDEARNNNETPKQDHLIESKEERNSNCDPSAGGNRGARYVVTSQEANDAYNNNNNTHWYQHSISSLNVHQEQLKQPQNRQQQWPQMTANTSPAPFKSTMMTSNKRNDNINNNRPATLQSRDKISSQARQLDGVEVESGRWRPSQRGRQTLGCCRQCCCPPGPVACCERAQLDEIETTTTSPDDGAVHSVLSDRQPADLEEDGNTQPEGASEGNGSAGRRAGGPEEIMFQPTLADRGLGNNEFGEEETQISWINLNGQYCGVDQGRDSYDVEANTTTTTTAENGPSSSSRLASDSNQLNVCMLELLEAVEPMAITSSEPDTKGNNNQLEPLNLSDFNKQPRWRQTNNKSCPSGDGARDGTLVRAQRDEPRPGQSASTNNQLERGECSARRCRRSRRLDCCGGRRRQQEQQLAPGDHSCQSTCSGPCGLIKANTDECVLCSSSSCCSSLTRRDYNHQTSHHQGQESRNHHQQQQQQQQQNGANRDQQSHHYHHHHHHNHRGHHRHHRQRASRSVPPPNTRANGNSEPSNHYQQGDEQANEISRRQRRRRRRHGDKTTITGARGELVEADIDSVPRRSRHKQTERQKVDIDEPDQQDEARETSTSRP